MLRGHCQTLGRCVLAEVVNQLQMSLPLVAGGFVVSIYAVITELLESKRAANRREVYLKSLSGYLARFAAGRESKALSSFTSGDVEDWLKQFKSAYSRQTWLNRISTLFSYGVRRGHCEKNPCDRIERVIVDRPVPKILTPSQADILLKVVPEVCRAYLVLGLFAGIRPDELMRLNWEDVDLETRTVRVNHAKTRRRRIVPLEPRAVELLKACVLKCGQVAPAVGTVRKFKRKARAVLNLTEWPADVLRHSAASYLLALLGDAGKVATRLGNSSAVLLSHYHEPVTKADCEKFWGICHTMSHTVGLEAPQVPVKLAGNGKIDCAYEPAIATRLEARL